MRIVRISADARVRRLSTPAVLFCQTLNPIPQVLFETWFVEIFWSLEDHRKAREKHGVLLIAPRELQQLVMDVDIIPRAIDAAGNIGGQLSLSQRGLGADARIGWVPDKLFQGTLWIRQHVASGVVETAWTTVRPRSRSIGPEIRHTDNTFRIRPRRALGALFLQFFSATLPSGFEKGEQ